MVRNRMVAAALALLVCTAATGAVYEAQWRKVREAEGKDLPRTALEALAPIERDARKAGDYPEALRALAERIALEAEIQGDKPEERILRLQREIQKAPEPMRPVLEAILGHAYWQYFQQNRWRFLQRSTTAAAPSQDFTTWDLPRIYAEIDSHFRRALSARALLRKIPVHDYDALLVQGNAPEAWRPTLYDFIAFEALAFYGSGEQAGARPEDSFEIPADSPIFAPAGEFVRWQVQASDSTSPRLEAIRLYQELLRVHAADADPSAGIDADLWRLAFGWNYAVGEGRSSRYQAALERLAARYADHELSTRALEAWAGVLYAEGKRAEAHRIATRGLARFPESVGGHRCFNLIQQIEAKSLDVTAERVWNAPVAPLRLRYRNLDHVYVRIVPVDFEAWVRGEQHDPESLSEWRRGEIDSLLQLRPALAWDAPLPPTPDFQVRSDSIPIPRGLRPGFYLAAVCEGPDFDTQRRPVQLHPFWVSDLALVLRDEQAGAASGFVLDAVSGDPVAGATVGIWILGRRGHWTPDTSTITDAAGRFSVRAPLSGYFVLARSGSQRLASPIEWRNDSRWSRTPGDRTLFFTDRSIYRPGQTVQYKGICIAVDQDRDRYQTLADRELTVVFSDPNGKEVERQVRRTNDYGSFSGSFTAPRDRLLGAMTLSVSGGPEGSGSIRVEEYKRPKFLVALDAPAIPSRLDAEVALAGHATVSTGAPVDGAQVSWRVVRQVRYPDWWSWRFGWWRPQRAEAQEIAHGTATTAVDGSFPIAFVARPDPAVKPEEEPIFTYSVHADVTDPAGETRSSDRIVTVGYTALAASLSVADWQETSRPVELAVRTRTLDGVARSARGALTVSRLRMPDRVVRAGLVDASYGWVDSWTRGRVAAPGLDRTAPASWPIERVVDTRRIETDSAGVAAASLRLRVGYYRARFETRDRFGTSVSAECLIQVVDPGASRCELKIADLLIAPRWSMEPGEEFLAVWGSGYPRARAYVEVEHRGRVLQKYWTDPSRTQIAIRQRVTEEMRGGFTIRVTLVRENRAYLHEQRVDVPWSDRQLSLRWEHLTSKLHPGQRETWTAVITGHDGSPAVAEMVATLYDASLDAFAPHGWMGGFGVFRTEYSTVRARFMNVELGLRPYGRMWQVDGKDGSLVYRTFPAAVLDSRYRIVREEMGEIRVEASKQIDVVDRIQNMAGAPVGAELHLRGGRADETKLSISNAASTRGLLQVTAAPDPRSVTARKNLQETAFFYPHLISNAGGEIRMEFTMPEALTEWRFLGFAHDARLRGGLLEGRTVTAKDLMVQPNPPRFLREGDVLEFTVKITNRSERRQSGRASLALTDAATERGVDAAFANRTPEQPFDVPAHESRTVAWRLSVPDDAGAVIYKATAATAALSDGEEGVVPVVSRSVLVTESLPLPIRGPATRSFEFTSLARSGHSSTLRHQTLTVQMVSNPAWYAVMALPYLMEYPYECTEQTFNRLYANALARSIANSDPKIRRVFDQWRGTPALDSPLEKNQDLKAVTLEETPWLLQGQKESAARRNVGILFDANRLDQESARTLARLKDLQLPDGAWPWFPGGPANDYITLYITTGFGRLRHLGVKVDEAPAFRSLNRLDGWMDRIYRDIPVADRAADHLTPTIALYLYGRSFFIQDQPVSKAHREAFDYWLAQARSFWVALRWRQSQGHLALALQRLGDPRTAKDIMRSLKERSVHSEELGMFWRDEEFSWWWYRAPIESQAMMIEGFDEILHDSSAVEECRVWLLKQKQTQDWKTTKATADAVYGLLIRGRDILASDALVKVALGGQVVKPEAVEAGTGFYEHRYARSEISPAMAQVTVAKTDRGVAWGSVHWQYLEDVSRIRPYTGTPLTLHKELFVRKPSSKGPLVEAVRGPLAVGDEVVVRIVLRTDRDMEYVHLKDDRGSGVEPVNVLSQYKYQDGLAYYEETRDVASHFFIDYLPKGTYVFEYSVRVQHRGRYASGMAQIQCMYAPEFNSHSESIAMEVR